MDRKIINKITLKWRRAISLNHEYGTVDSFVLNGNKRKTMINHVF